MISIWTWNIPSTFNCLVQTWRAMWWYSASLCCWLPRRMRRLCRQDAPMNQVGFIFTYKFPRQKLWAVHFRLWLGTFVKLQTLRLLLLLLLLLLFVHLFYQIITNNRCFTKGSILHFTVVYDINLWGWLQFTFSSYVSGLYECDYSTLSGSSLLPLQASGFDPIPQRLRMIGLPSSLTSAVFDSDFQNFNDCEFLTD